ncbi:MAG: HEAT repeat domain-containing protein [Planctomycetota bacterium]
MSSNPEGGNPPSPTPVDSVISNASVSTDELLPPVEPPSAGFIIQLFVVPAVIVLAVVLLWLIVTTLATQGDQDPAKIVGALRGSNQARWQKADELANMLRLEKRYPELKHNSELAAELAKLLDEEVEAGLDDKNSISLRYYLCRVLGEFYVDNGLAVLLKAARLDPERDVRREAINALAVLSQAFQDLEPPKQLEHNDLVKTFSALADDPDDLIRSQTAFALGVFSQSPNASPLLTVELQELVDDLYYDARYNAALALARQGNLKSTSAIAEMFNAEALALSTESEKGGVRMQSFKRDTMLKNALEAAQQLMKKNPTADFGALRAAIGQFTEEAPQWQPMPVPESLIDRGNQLLAK